MVNRLDGLWHHPIVSGDDQDGDIGDLGSSCPHGREGLMARGVYKGDPLALRLHLIGTYVLRDPPCFPSNHVCPPDHIQKGGLAMVHVPHHRHHWRAEGQFGLLRRLLGKGDGFWGRWSFLLHPKTHILGHDGCGLVIYQLIDTGYDAILHQCLDNINGADLHQVGQFPHGYDVRHFDNLTLWSGDPASFLSLRLFLTHDTSPLPIIRITGM